MTVEVGIRPRPGYNRAMEMKKAETAETAGALIEDAPAGDAAASDSEAAARAHVRDVVLASGSSFISGMRLLPAPRREAMYAVYAFAREVDDIADEPASNDDKRLRLDAWRVEIDALYAGRPTTPTGRALVRPVADYGLRRKDFLGLIEGMEMDAYADMRGPPMADLERYCDRVASAVGRMSVRIFGAGGPAADTVAEHLGQALQLTNILRDLLEDAERGRLYLPAELLDKYGIGTREPLAVLADARLPRVCDELAALAMMRYRKAQTAFDECPARPMRAAVVMMHIYRRILDALLRRGWHRYAEPVRVRKRVKIWIALRYGLF
jgi:phytoene synthase